MGARSSISSIISAASALVQPVHLVEDGHYGRRDPQSHRALWEATNLRRKSSGGSLMSATRSTRSAWEISDRVERKALIRKWGRSSMKPTVSVSRTLRPPISRALVVGERVVKGLILWPSRLLR